MSLIYWLSKFSQEALLVELFLIACITTAYFGYLLIQKRKYGAAKKAVPDHIVRAYLAELISTAEGFKNQLFGENFRIQAGQGVPVQMPTISADGPLVTGGGGGDEAARAQLAAAMAKQEELQRTLNNLTKDKSTLESKLATASAAATQGAAESKALAELKEKLAKVESRLSEYEVIEDDLANLKKYQQENKQLRAQLTGMGVTPTAEPVVSKTPEPAVKATPAPAPAEEPKISLSTPEPTPATPEPKAEPVAAPAAAAEPAASPIASAEESVNETKAAQSLDELMGQVNQSLTPPAGASASDPLAAAVQAKPSTDTPAPAAQAAPAAPAAEAKQPEKSDADLLSEFERMLNS